MADIFHTFPIIAPLNKVFNGISSSEGLDKWWTKSSKSKPEMGATYVLDFGPGYEWPAIVTKFIADKEFELRMTPADTDWNGTRVGFILSHKEETTTVNFYHTGWPESNDHYRISSYCWAMYLRILKRNLEYGEEVPYKDRLNV